MKKIWNVFSTALVSAVIILAVALVGVRLVGIKVYTVLSPSMEPVYHVGSLIYVKEANKSELNVGDAITFTIEDGTIVTHNIIEVIEDDHGTRYRTQGEANDTADGGSVDYRNVIGKPFFSIPYLGYFVSYIQHPPGKYVVIAGVAILIITGFLSDLFGKKKKD